MFLLVQWNVEKLGKILHELDRQLIAGKDVKMFKPSIDDRFGTNTVATRSGGKVSAININSIDELENYDADIYVIDEFQFLNGNVSTIEKLAEKGKKFYISGLNLTAEKKPFGKMGDLMCIADNIQMMTSICEICKCENAVFSFFKGGKTGDIFIGDSEYIPVCRNCYEKLNNELTSSK